MSQIQVDQDKNFNTIQEMLDSLIIPERQTFTNRQKMSKFEGKQIIKDKETLSTKEHKIIPDPSFDSAKVLITSKI